MKKRIEKASREKDNSGVEKEPSQSAGLNMQDKSSVQSFDDYQCSGNLDVDFSELCSLLGLGTIPHVRQMTTGAMASTQEKSFSESCKTAWSSEPCLQFELENEDIQSVKRVRISGWRVDESMSRVLGKTLPSLSNLQSLEMWQVGLSDSILTSIKDTISLCSTLRRVILDGTPVPESTYHSLLGDGSMIKYLSLRNNHIGEEGARLISLALSKNLLSLNMAYNTVGDVGAMYLAQGLRLNRTLLYLSLASNHITDVGAAHLAQVFGPFALSHKEIVERRRLKRKDQLAKEVFETQVLLDPAIQHIEGKVMHPGNTTLLSLNLSGNKLTQQSLQVFLSSIEHQGKKGLQNISLNRNSFSQDCEVFLKLQEIMSMKHPLTRTSSDSVESDQGEAA